MNTTTPTTNATPATQGAILRKTLDLLFIYTRHTFNIDLLAGDAMKPHRQQIMSALAGKKIPVSKSGVYAIQAAFYAAAGSALDGYTCEADRQDKFAVWAKAQIAPAQPTHSAGSLVARCQSCGRNLASEEEAQDAPDCDECNPSDDQHDPADDLTQADAEDAPQKFGNPAVHLTRTETGWTLIKDGMPLCAEGSLSDALATGARFQLHIPAQVWISRLSRFGTISEAKDPAGIIIAIHEKENRCHYSPEQRARIAAEIPANGVPEPTRSGYELAAYRMPNGSRFVTLSDGSQATWEAYCEESRAALTQETR